MSNSEQDVHGSPTDPLTDLYTRLEHRLREKEPAAVGWIPHLAALRALRTQQVAGDPQILSSLLDDPAALPEDAPVQLISTSAAPAATQALVESLLAKGEHALLLTATPEQATEIIETLDTDSGMFVLHLEPEATVDRPSFPLPKGRGDQGSNGTVEFRPPSLPLSEPAAPEPDVLVRPATPEVPPEDEIASPQTPEGEAASAATMAFEPVTDPDPGEETVPSEEPAADSPEAAPPDLVGPQGTAPLDPEAIATSTTASPVVEEPVEADPHGETPLTPTPVIESGVTDPLDDAEPGAVADPESPAAQTRMPLEPAMVESIIAAGPAEPAAEPSATEPDELESPSVITRHDTGVLHTLPEDPTAPETRVSGAVVRAVGDSWRQAWENEGRLLQRGMLWLEQWPRDVAALEGLRGEQTARRGQTDAELTSLAGQVEQASGHLKAAEQAIVNAAQEAERLAAAQEAAAAEVAEPRAEAERLQQAADTAGTEAGELTRSADTAHERCTALVEQTGRAQAEMEAARQQEGSLTGKLVQANEELPRAAEEAERLVAADADAVAEGHASYYRLVSAESALSALRQQMTLSQRLHVAAPPSDFKQLRAEVKARTREADEAGQRAQQIQKDAERAAEHRAGLERFISEGGAGLAAAKQAQQRLGEELQRLADERESAGTVYRDQARLAAEAVDRATQASAAARYATQSVRALEERLAAIQTDHEIAHSTAERARADVAAATAGLAEAEALLESRRAEAEQRLLSDESELAALVEAESRSRAKVEEVCGPDPVPDPVVLADHQKRAMTRIEQLTAYLDAAAHDALGPIADVLLRTADIVCGTPVSVGAASPEPAGEYDVLIAVGPLTEAEFLIGAVRARRWILIGSEGERPPFYPEYAVTLSEDEAERLRRGVFAHAAAAAPHLVETR